MGGGTGPMKFLRQRLVSFQRIPSPLLSEQAKNIGFFVITGICPKCEKDRKIIGVDSIDTINQQFFSEECGRQCLVCECGITDALAELDEEEPRELDGRLTSER